MLKAGVWGFAGIDGSFCVRFSKGFDGCQKKESLDAGLGFVI